MRGGSECEEWSQAMNQALLVVAAAAAAAFPASTSISAPAPASTTGYRIICARRRHPLTGERCYATGVSTVAERLIREGDILVGGQDKPGNSIQSFKNAITDPKLLWPNATVHYIFHQSFTEENKETIRRNLRWLEDRTCVRFAPWEGSGDYALVTNEEGCHSTLGHDIGPRGHARVNIHNSSCLKRPGTIQHEFLHLLGLKHEQARPDRDYYVQIIWDNIRPGHRKNFEKADPTRFTTFGLPYNYKSVMHYSNVEFSKNGQPTIVARKNHNMTLGQRLQATEIDLKKIRLLYNC